MTNDDSCSFPISYFCGFINKGMKKILYAIFFVIMLIWPSFMLAQDTLDSPKSSKTNKLIEKISEHASVGGWIDAQYSYDRADDASQSSVFQIRRARVDIKGSLSRWVDFRLQADFAPSPRLIDAFVKVNLCKYVNVQVGQFKIPFSLENKYSPLDLELTENAQVISALSGYKDVTGISSYANGREIGLMLTGTLASANVRGERIPILTYGVGVFGGNGINVKTDNLAKDFSARLEFCPFVKGLNISVSEYWGRYNMLYNNNPTGMDGTRFRMASGIEYKHEGLDVRGEYLWGVTDFALYTNGPYGEDYHFVSSPTLTDGFYVIGSYWFNFGWGKNSSVKQKLRPVFRFDFYRYNRNDVSDRPSLYYSAGLDWWPENHLRVQLDYTLKQRYGIDGLGHNLTAMVSVKF